jgi:hypothetical protein
METSAQPLPAGNALLPRPARRVVGGVIAVLLGFAAYLLAVRGPAILLDLAHGAAAMFCF